jgi:DNA-binding MarR family transcriptional regulator
LQVLEDFNDILRFGFLIHDVSRIRRVVADRMLKPLGVTRSQWWLLAYLSRRDGMTQTALARDLDLSRVAMGELISRLEEAGYLQRRDDASDGRARRVYLTKKGAALIWEIRTNIEGVERQALDGISAADLETTARTLRAIKQRSLNALREDQ